MLCPHMLIIIRETITLPAAAGMVSGFTGGVAGVTRALRFRDGLN